MPVIGSPFDAGPQSPPDLISPGQAGAALAELGLTAAQLAYLPAVITAASDAVRRACGDRDFDLRQYDRIFPVGLDGTVSLPQVPVQKVSRVAAGRTAALSVANADRAANQRAAVEFDVAGDEAAGITCSGLILTTVAAGVTTAASLPFASYPTLAALAAAIAGAGRGWTATVATGFEAWGTGELIAGDGAAQDGFAGAALGAWAEDLAGCRLDRRTGTLDVGAGRTLGLDGPRWGPGWEVFEIDERESYRRVRVVYTAGFATIPPMIEAAVALTCVALFSALRSDPRVASEGDGAYSYTLAEALAHFAVPPAALAFCAPYTLHHA